MPGGDDRYDVVSAAAYQGVVSATIGSPRQDVLHVLADALLQQRRWRSSAAGAASPDR
jgi:hypothetical protein